MAAPLIDGFRDYLISLERSPATIAGYIQDMQRFIFWWGIDTRGTRPRPLDFTPYDLTASDVRAYRASLEERHLKPATLNRALVSMRTFAAYLTATGQIAANPLAGPYNTVRMAQEQALAPRWLTRTQAAAIQRQLELRINYAKSPQKKRLAARNMTIYLVLLNTGLRVAELTALTWGDVSFGVRSGSLRVRQGKGGKERIVPLNEPARTALTSLTAYEPFFLYDKIYPLTSDAIQRVIRQAGEWAGLKGVTPHTLRHTCAKALVDAGVSLEKVAAILGHASLETTRIYTVPSLEDLEKAVDKIS